MIILIVGLVLLLGPHFVRAAAPEWRRVTNARIGALRWRVIYSVVSIIGLILVIWGFGLARQNPVMLWSPPVWTRHIAITLNLIAFFLLGVYLVPAGKLRAWLGHPMLLAVKIWAVAHLLANGNLNDVVLFGSFLVWAVIDYAANRRRDRAEGTVRIGGPVTNDVIAVALGLVLWAAMLWRVHYWLIGVSPLA
jgi:uncharacterized membrane protein